MLNTSIKIEDVAEKERSAKGWPKAGFKPKWRGQAAYILNECEKSGIRAKYLYGKVRIYSDLKKKDFLDIIGKSFIVRKERNGLTADVHKWKCDGKLICIGIKDENCLFCTEVNLDKVVIGQYLGNIPVTRKIKVLNNEEEFFREIITKGVIA